MHGPPTITADPVPIDRIRRPLQRILHLEVISGVTLISAALVAVVVANSPAGDTMADFWHTYLEIKVGPLALKESLGHWVNDALMTVFFLVAGLEIKRELVCGDLRDPRKAALPALAALGGMLVPAGLYALISGPASSHGWGIPMATDIAFAVGVLTLVGKRVPSSLKIFLLTLAIVDDLGAIIVIAVFYTASLNLGALGLAAAGLASMVVLRRLGVWWIPIYVMIGAGVWLATFESGVHATLAGVACGLLTPARPHRPRHTQVLATPDTSVDELREILFDARETVSVADRLVRALHPWTALFIIPVFALANAGVVMSGESLKGAFTSSASLAIIVALVVGKPVGITLASVLAVKSGIASLPANATWRQLMGVSVLGGIGFTVSLFITELAFTDEALIPQAKIGVLVASVAASLLGAVALKFLAVGPVRREEIVEEIGEIPAADGTGLGPITFAEFDQTRPSDILAPAPEQAWSDNEVGDRH